MRHVLLGDNAKALREQISQRSADMIYLDPPFGTGRIWTGKAGSFDDRWKWDAASTVAFDRISVTHSGLANILRAFPIKRDDLAYLVAMADLLLACRGVLKLTGSLWLHCDPTWGHYLRIIGDQLLLGRGEIIWKRTGANSSAKKRLSAVHDNIFVFARSRASNLRLDRVRQQQRPRDHEINVVGDALVGLHIEGLVLDEFLNATASERVDYPTQKPMNLLRRLIATATLPGDLVIDPCCGSGTTLLAAIDIGRAAIGIDRSADAVKLAERRIAAVTRQADLLGRVLVRLRKMDSADRKEQAELLDLYSRAVGLET